MLSVAVRMPADTKKPVLLMQLPLGVYLPAGATLQIGKEEAKTLPFTELRSRRLHRRVRDVTDAELAAIAKGADITISAQGAFRGSPSPLRSPRSASPRPTRRSSNSANRSPRRPKWKFFKGDVAMRLDTKLCGQRLIAGSILGLMMTTGGVAQTAQQKQPAPQGAAAHSGATGSTAVRSTGHMGG